MPTLDWYCETEEGVTLVHLVVTSERTAQVRIENCLDGPVWPPRSEGVPEAGWDDAGFEGVVDPDERLVLGYASPAAPADPPARIADVDPGDPERDLTPRDVVRTLGDAAPPRDAIRDGTADEADAGGRCTAKADASSRRTTTPAQNTCEESGRQIGTDAVGPSVEAWFAGLDDRLETAERLDAASSVAEAESAVASAGGVDEVRALRARLERDRERLARLGERCEAMRERAAAVDVPVETLSRLA